tara:strand:- start:1144 stop:1641 length:498 start_codon:yes stop_codon:yes gene_type:complete
MTALMTRVLALWAGRSTREQALMAGLGLILAGLVIAYGAVLPASSYRSDSRVRYEASAERYLRTEAALASVAGRAGPSAPSTSDRPVRTVASERAAAHGLAISRVLPDGDDRLNVWIESGLAESLTDWLTDLDRNHSIQVERLTIDRRGDRVVSAQIVLTRGGAG